MSLFDSLGSLFSSGSGAASAGPNWASMLGPLLSQIRTTSNPGATKGDIARAGRMNLFTGLLGGLASAYGARQQATAQSEANSGLLDIIAKGGGERATEAAGPVMPGMSQPTVMSKVPMSEAFAGYGKDHPLAMDSALKLALAAQGNEREDAYNERRMSLEQSHYADQQNQWKQSFDQNKAHLKAIEGNAAASLRLERDRYNLQKNESEALRPYKQLANERSAYGDDIANELMRSRLGAGGVPAPEVDKGEVGGFTPAVRPQATIGQPAGINVAALMDGVAAKNATREGVKRLDTINSDPALRSATEDYRKGRQALESVAQLVNTGELQSMDRQMIAKRIVQSVEPGLAVGPGEGEAALSRLGTAGVYVKNWLDDMFADGTRLGPTQIKRALEQLAINVSSQRRSALDLIGNKRQYGAATGVTPEQLPLIGNGFVDGGDPMQLSNDAWTMFSTKGQPNTGSPISGREAELEMRKSAILAKRGW